jgi:peptidoglycan/xylan/chitin deacetylase (PgdA/CDA1 family)
MRRLARSARPGVTASGASVGSLRPAARRRARLMGLSASFLVGLGMAGAVPAGAGGLPYVIRTASAAGPSVALTFDDGSSLERCRSIAGALRDRRVVATFLVNGSHLDEDPDAWRETLEGMPVALHGYRHQRMTQWRIRKVRTVIARDIAAVRRDLGREPLPLLRPPGGFYDRNVIEAARAEGIEHLVLWTTRTLDRTPGLDAATIVERAVGAASGSIILMHCGPAPTVDAVPAIVDWYLAQGYRLVGLDELLRVRWGPSPAA